MLGTHFLWRDNTYWKQNEKDCTCHTSKTLLQEVILWCKHHVWSIYCPCGHKLKFSQNWLRPPLLRYNKLHICVLCRSKMWSIFGRVMVLVFKRENLQWTIQDTDFAPDIFPLCFCQVLLSLPHTSITSHASPQFSGHRVYSDLKWMSLFRYRNMEALLVWRMVRKKKKAETPNVLWCLPT